MTCRLPGGYRDEQGQLHRETELVPLSGHEEELLADLEAPAPAALVTTVLSRCTRRIGSLSPVDEALARRLLVGDRQFLLLKLRQATFGSRVQATVACPWPDCGERADLEFSIDDVPVTEARHPGPLHRMELSAEAALVDEDGQAHREVEFRLPDGGDQEAISPLLARDEAAALTALLGRCVQRIGKVDAPGEESLRRLPAWGRAEIERAMEDAAPRLELTMELRCPECGRPFSMPLELQDFFFGELRMSRDLLYREVHYLAFHYHWSERDILDLPRERRRTYIEVLAEEIERLNDAAG
jgi:hypothetical protein